MQDEVRRLGGTPLESDSRRDTISGLDGIEVRSLERRKRRDDASCETGDDSAAAAFERVVNLDISGPAKSLVEKQWRKIVEAHAHMLRLKEEKTADDFPANNSR